MSAGGGGWASGVQEVARLEESLLLLPRLLRRSPQGTVATAPPPLPVRVSAGTASPVPEAASRPPLPLPSPSTCKQQVEPRPCQWSVSTPLLRPGLPPQAWSALNLDLSVPLRPLKGDGVRGEGRRGAKGSSPRPCKGNSGPSREHGTWEASSRRGPASPVRDT